MPRKFRLSVPVKNGPRKSRGRSVTVDPAPLSVDTSSFPVCLPIDFLWDLQASTLAVLQKRVKELSALPCGMYAMNAAAATAFICTL